MNDDFRAWFQPTPDLSFKRRGMINLDFVEGGSPILYHEQAPMFAKTKESTNRHPQHIVTFPGNNTTFDTIAVTHRDCGFFQIRNDVHALLLNAQGRYFGESGRFD